MKEEQSNTVKLNIDGKDIEVEKGSTILQAAKKLGIFIPTLCYLKEVNEIGACRMCIVEVEGARGFVTSCVMPASDGMIVRTNTKAIKDARKVTLELLLSNHDRNCLTCVKNKKCELQTLSEKLNVRDIRFEGERIEYDIDDESESIVRDPNKCILCKRCIAMCKKVQKVGAIDAANRGIKTTISTTFDKSLADVNCINCGQCILVCPTGALTEKDDTKKVTQALENKDLHVVVQTAPAVRAAIGEEFGMPIGTLATGKMVAGLKALGFAKVFDTDTGADITIMEEATELVDRIKNKGVLPMITSCSPGWVKYIEHTFPELLPHLSTCKSPHVIFGALLKSYYAKKNNIDSDKIFVVSVMPCTAKKFEASREEMKNDGRYNVDAVITTRELARMLKEANIDISTLEDENFDDPMGEATGAGVIFGTTGGVMEAALRTAYELITGKGLEKVDFKDVRGQEGIKEATIKVGDMDVKVAVASSLSNAEKLMKKIKEGKADYSFIEIMACPGGCINGGGQPIHDNKTRATVDIRQLRADALYTADEKSKIRKSHENPVLKKIYKEYLGEPGHGLAHELLHTHYHEREKIKQ